MKTMATSNLMNYLGPIFVYCLAISTVSCAPSSKQSSSQAPATPVTTQASVPQSTSAASAKTTSAPNAATVLAPVSQLFPSASTLASRGSAARGPSAFSYEPMEAFEGRNPFSDDSLWQIPVHLVRDLSSVEGSPDGMARSASEMSAADEDDDERELVPPAANLPQSSSSTPTVIAASTDLKTAAGFYYPTHGHHSGYSAQESGHHGGHHYGGGDHYGKYFQYASVPYPGAWEFGYRRGNPYHTIERYEHGKGPHFQTKVKWNDKDSGYGVHVWDYNHDDHYSNHYGGGHHDSYAPSHYGGGHHGSHYGHH